MAELLAQFRELVSESMSTPGAGVELLLLTLEPEAAQLLKTCAIPHHYTPDILQILDTELSSAEAETHYKEFLTLPVTLIFEDRLALNDEARLYLFKQWLRPENIAELRIISQRLSDYFAVQAQSAEGIVRQTMERHALFHLFAVDQEAAFSEFERQWKEDYRQCGVSSCQALLGLAREYQDVLSQERAAWLTFYDAQLADDLGHTDRAVELLSQLRQDPAAAMHNRLQIQVCIRLGMLTRKQNYLPQAISYLQDALALAGQQIAGEEILGISYEFGVTYHEKGELDTAETWFKKCLDLPEASTDFSSKALVLNGLGNLYLDMGNTEQATVAFNDALDSLGRIGDRFRMAGVYNNLGKAFSKQRDWATAEKYYQDSLKIKQQAGDTLGQALSLNNLIQVYRNQGYKEQAIKVGNEAARLFQEIRDYNGAAVAKRNVGRLYREMGDNKSFLQAFTDSTELFQRAGELEQVVAVKEELRAATSGIPWWAWIPLILLVIVIIFALIGQGLMSI